MLRQRPIVVSNKIHNHLSHFGKRLDVHQVATLINHVDSHEVNPTVEQKLMLSKKGAHGAKMQLVVIVVIICAQFDSGEL
jgi:hypothetical protein